MIESVIMYGLKCDRCKKQFEDSFDDFVYFDDQGYVEDRALDSDWILHNNKHYCPDCVEMNDVLGEFLPKKPIPGYVFKLKLAMEYIHFFLDGCRGTVQFDENDSEYILKMYVPTNHIPIEYLKTMDKIHKYYCTEYVNNDLLMVKIPK